MTVAYYTGTVNSLSELLTAVAVNAQAEGYAFNSSTGDLSKAGVPTARLTVTGTAAAQRLNLQMQTPTVSPNAPGLKNGNWGNPKAGVLTTWPAEYHMHVYTGPDLIVVSLLHDVSFWQRMMWGNAVSLGCPGTGSGNVPFYFATYQPGEDNSVVLVNMGSDTGQPGPSANRSSDAIPFFKSQYQGTQALSSCGYGYTNDPADFYSVGSPAATWVSDRAIYWGGTDSSGNAGNIPGNDALNIQLRQPSAWNNEAVLSPIRTFARRPSSFLSPMFELPHMRVVRNDYIDDKQVLVDGSRKWFVMSGRRKNAASRTMANSASQDHSGTWALALEHVP